MTDRSTEPADLPKLPGLRSAMLLYLLVILATTAIFVGLSDPSSAVDVVFLRLIVGVFVFGGFTAAALLITGVSLGSVSGRRPNLLMLINSFLAGLAVYIPASWLLTLVSQTLGGLYGNLPAVLGSQPSLLTLVIVMGVLIPLGEGVLFFGLIQTAARGIGRWRAVELVALLFGVFGLFSAGFGVSAVLPFALIGLVAAALTARSGSVLAGVLVLSGFNLGDPIVGVGLQSVLKGQFFDILSFGWLSVTALGLLVTFILVQVAGALFAAPSTAPIPGAPPVRTAPIRRFWFVPLIVVLLLAALVSYGDIITRRQNPVRSNTTAPVGGSGSTLPPQPATSVPTLQATQATH